MSALLKPTKVGAVEVKNCVFMAPLTRNRAEADGTPGELAATYYKQRAGAGLIITEAAQISAMGKGYINTPGIYQPEHVEAWRRIVSTVHADAGKIFLQLWHVGRISHTSLLPEGSQPLAPSAISAGAQTHTAEGPQDVSEPRAMTIDDIKQTVADYRHAAECAKAAGFDGVEVHAANGYLIDQFIRDKTNQREDEYGGSPDNRLRFLDEVLTAVTEIWESDRVGVRLSPTGTFNDIDDSNPLETFAKAIDVLNDHKVAYLHVVERFPGVPTSEAQDEVVDSLLKVWKGFYIANGDYDEDRGNAAIDSGHADAITFGRPFIANPDLPTRFEKGADLNEPNPETFYGGGAEGYTDYPFLND